MKKIEMARKLAEREAQNIGLSEIQDILVNGTTGWMSWNEDDLKEEYEKQFGKIETEIMVAYLPPDDIPEMAVNRNILICNLPDNPSAQIMTLKEFQSKFNSAFVSNQGYIYIFERDKL